MILASAPALQHRSCHLPLSSCPSDAAAAFGRKGGALGVHLSRIRCAPRHLQSVRPPRHTVVQETCRAATSRGE
eukprot:scaffold652_cov260-Pinguiococcus_pyrenoidosus.AAC.6